MPNFEFYSNKVNDFFLGNYVITSGSEVPDASQISFGKNGKEMELVMLFIDLRESTRIVDSFRRQTAAKMYKSFLWGISQIANKNGGKLRSFNGDGVLVVFAGEDKSNKAVRAALQMSYFVTDILKPKVDAYMRTNNDLVNMTLGFGIGIDIGQVLVVKGGFKGDNNNDLVWVGNPTNYAVKLSNISGSGIGHIRIMKAVYDDLIGNNKYSTQLGLKVDIWKLAELSIPIKIVASPKPLQTPNLLASMRLLPPKRPLSTGLAGVTSSLNSLTGVPNKVQLQSLKIYYHTSWRQSFIKS